MVYIRRKDLQERLIAAQSQGGIIGFVPTMGALHQGHLALVKKAKEECDIVVVSIFVNPTQFNNPSDLEKYPRMPEKDVELLNTLGEILVFLPSVEEVYPKDDHFPGVELNLLDKVLEGEFRPGHFQGVTHVVYNLFEIVKANKAYFGKKDYQQVAVIKEMVRQLNYPIEIIACPTLREENGLAMSSRNMRLTANEREEALIIVNSLRYLKSLVPTCTPAEAQNKAKIYFGNRKLQLEYLEIIDGDTFQSLTNSWGNNPICCIAAQCGAVRLIDNAELLGAEI